MWSNFAPHDNFAYLWMKMLVCPARVQSAQARRARALSALGLLLADGALTVG